MDDSKSGVYADSEEENEAKHFKLLKSLERTFDGGKQRRLGGATRTEAAKEINEFNFRSGHKPTLTIEKVLASIQRGNEKKKKTDDVSLESCLSLKAIKEIRTLTKPLEKPASEKIKRAVLYDNVKKDISKWNSVVYQNRIADQLVFPLASSKKLPRKTTKDVASEFVPETPLEEEMARILHGDEYVTKKKAEVYGKHPVKSDAQTYVLGIEEALEKHREMARLRALQSYEQVKAKRQSKIKSKKYHRLIRREKIRRQLKEFEQLQKTDPEAALVKLEELDKSRVQERMSLKHRNTSKWAKMQSARAKYDRESRSALSDQLKISRDLTKKVQMESTEDEDDLIGFELPNLVKSCLTNPWVLEPSVKDNEKVHLYYTGYKKFWQDVNERKEKERQKHIMIEEANQTEKDEKKFEKNSLPNETGVKLDSSTPANSEQLDTIVNKKKSKKSRKLKSKESKVQEEAALVPKANKFLRENEEVTLDILDKIMDEAEERIKIKAIKKLESLEREAKMKRKSSECKQKAKKFKNLKGDEEIQDLNVDELAKNKEGLSASDEKQEEIPVVGLTYVHTEGHNSFAQKPSQPTKTLSDRKIIDPNNFLKIGKSPTFDMGAMDEAELLLDAEVHGELDDPEEERLKIIAEAFEDEDLLEEFKKKKQEEVDTQTPKDVNLALPGWGDWGGKNLKPNLKKRKRFTVPAPKPPPRQDARISHVIINDDANLKLREHQVRVLPFPFKRVQDFEKMIRAPVGRTWLTEPAMKSLTAPKVITRLGAVIQPISEDVLVSKAELQGKMPKLTGLKLTSATRTRK